MDITTIKLKKSTKLALKSFIKENESYDVAIRKLISKIKYKDLKENLIEGYKTNSKENLKILNEWENASRELI
ncbi:MAG: hypothetical protein AABW56_03295 [Nanoarchaeota archaeon]